MNKGLILWFLILITSGICGFLAATSHVRPRVVMNRHILHMLIKKPVNERTYTPGGNNWDEVRRRYEEHERESDTNKDKHFVKTEDWYLWKGPGQPQKVVRLVYNSVTDEITVSCLKPDCLE